MMNADHLVNHFNLNQLPFGRAVSEAGLLHHRTFTEALARLSLALSTKTPALFTAEPGLGKSTLLGNLADSLDKTTNHLVYTPLCSCGPFGLIGQLAVRYGLRPKRSASQTAQAVLDELARSGRNEILILDEAHRLPAATLDELRLLSNLDFDRVPPFALILAGQTPLRNTLAQPELASLHQRLAIRASPVPFIRTGNHRLPRPPTARRRSSHHSVPPPGRRSDLRKNSRGDPSCQQSCSGSPSRRGHRGQETCRRPGNR